MKALIEEVSKEGIARVSVLYPDEFVPESMVGQVHDVLTFEEPENLFGKAAILFYNVNTKTVYHEYEDRPLTQDESVQVQANEIETLKIMVADLGLMVGGGL